MRCPHCGARVAESAGNVSQCPVCKRELATQAGAPARKPGPARRAATAKFEAGAEAAPKAAAGPRKGAGGVNFDKVSVAAPAEPKGGGPKSAPSSPRARAAGKGKLPEKFGPFQVRGKLGEGGMGAVYDGYDPNLDRRVAIKVLSPRLAQDEQFVQRFLAEARAVARVAHPNVCSVFSAGSEGDEHFFAMEFVEGESLDDRVEDKGPFTPKSAIGYVVQAVRGLGAAHERGIVHRDVKPANLMLSKDDEIKVTDFGLAKRSGENLKLTQAGSVMGSPHFMAPEQGRGEDTDVRADVYSLGATLYYLLTGKPPYDGDTSLAIILKHQEGPVPQIVRAPPSLNRLLGKMMAKSPAARYAGYADLMDDLVRLDRSGLLRDEVLEAGIPAAAAPVGPAPAAPAQATPVASPRPARTTDMPTQQADDEAVLLSQLDSAMKRTPGSSAAAPARPTRATKPIRPGRRGAGPGGTAFSAEGDEAGAAEGAEEKGRKSPLLLYAGVGAGTVFLLIVVSLEPWTWGGGPELSPKDAAIIKAIEDLRLGRESSSPGARQIAVRGLLNTVKKLGAYGDARVKAELRRALSDASPEVRSEVVKVLGVVSGEDAVNMVCGVLTRDRSPDVREVAARTLEEITRGDLSGVDWRNDPEAVRNAKAADFLRWWNSSRGERGN